MERAGNNPITEIEFCYFQSAAPVRHILVRRDGATASWSSWNGGVCGRTYPCRSCKRVNAGACHRGGRNREKLPAAICDSISADV